METKKNPLHDKECVYTRSSLDWATETETHTDKCVLLTAERGSATLLLGEDEVVVDKSNVLFLRPELPIRKLHATADFLAAVVAFPPFMLRDSVKNVAPRFLLQLFTQTVWPADKKSRRLLRNFFGLFHFATENYGHGFTREMAVNLTNSLVYGFYELAVIEKLDLQPSDSSRTRELFHRFMELIHEHIFEEHEVQFYASKLCISSKYLTQITKCVLGHTPKQIIDETLLQEAMRLLDRNDSSIQSIGNALGFPDQSYFGRFFRRMKQMSPQQYRMRSK